MMSDFARRPTVQEIEQLREQVRRAPGSPAFVQLGEAYLALGRPGDAVEVGVRGLQANPESTSGRMMIGRAYVMLHQWQNAQTELLKLVKVDRNHAAGFALLGEVLLRRQDLERALPVLQHALNLNPTNPYVEDLLRRARTGVPPDPPPPIPAPQEPESGYAAPSFPARAASADPLQFGADEPTRVAPGMLGGPTAPPPAQPAPHAPHGPAAMPASGAKTIVASVAPTASSMPAAQPMAPPPAAPLPAAPPRPAPPEPAKADKKPKAQVAPADVPPPGPPTGVRPRVVSMDKPTDAAKQALRQAADVGDYLNTLLTQGLLSVPAVEARIDPMAIKPAKRWGRSTTRTFVFLFALLAVGLGGGGYWMYQAQVQKKEQVARHLARADTLLQTASYTDLIAALEETASALQRDESSLVAMAKFARVGAAMALLYGTPTSKANAAMLRAREGIPETDPAWADIVFARVALALATLGDEAEGTPLDRLNDARASVDAWLAEHPDDAWVHWLAGIARLEISDLSGAAQAFEQAEAGGQGPVVATIYRADMQADAGDLEGATKRYEQALERASKHPLAVVGKALVRIDQAADPADILGDLNTQLPEEAGPRVDAYKALASALSYLWLRWDQGLFIENLAKAEGVREPRFLARVALAQLANGRLSAAGDTRNRIVWYSKEPKETHPLVATVDAHLQWLTGLPAPVLDILQDIDTVRARHVRSYALYDLGRIEDAEAELAAILEIAPEDWEAQTWHAAARMIRSRGKARREADSELKQLGRQQASKVVRYVHGTAWQRIGDRGEARARFTSAVEDLTKERPNPLAYRAHTALAELDIEDQQLDSAVEHLEQAIGLNPGYLPAIGLLGRVQTLRGEHAEAVATLKPIIDEPGAATAAVELAFAESLVAGGDAGEEARKLAAEAVQRAQKKGASAEEVARVTALINGEQAAEPAAPARNNRRRGRRGR